MAKKRQQNIIRTDYLEAKIAYYWAVGKYSEEAALRKVASDVHAPINEKLISVMGIEKREALNGN